MIYMLMEGVDKFKENCHACSTAFAEFELHLQKVHNINTTP